MQHKDNFFQIFERNESMKYFAYLGIYFSTAQTEPLKTFLEQLQQLIVEAWP